MNYINKYIKYKLKYIELINNKIHSGGGDCEIILTPEISTQIANQNDKYKKSIGTINELKEAINEELIIGDIFYYIKNFNIQNTFDWILKEHKFLFLYYLKRCSDNLSRNLAKGGTISY